MIKDQILDPGVNHNGIKQRKLNTWQLVNTLRVKCNTGIIWQMWQFKIKVCQLGSYFLKTNVSQGSVQ